MKKYKLLLVEDDKIVAEFIEGMLNNIGYTNVTKVYDAKSALEKLSNELYDLALMDINLGKGKDGIDVMNEVKKYSDIPFIYITGYSDIKTIKKAKFSAPDGFIIKPFKSIDIKVSLELVLYKAARKKEKKTRLSVNKIKSITPREKEVLMLVMKGLSNKMIGNMWAISEITVSIHRSNLMKKVGAKNTADLVKIAIDNNLNFYFKSKSPRSQK